MPPENLSDLLGRVSKNLTGEIDSLIGDFEQAKPSGVGRRRLCCLSLKRTMSSPLPTAMDFEELDPITANRPMTAEQAATLKRLADSAYELDAFKPNLTRAEADVRIAMLTAKLKLLDGPPHTL